MANKPYKDCEFIKQIKGAGLMSDLARILKNGARLEREKIREKAMTAKTDYGAKKMDSWAVLRKNVVVYINDVFGSCFPALKAFELYDAINNEPELKHAWLSGIEAGTREDYIRELEDSIIEDLRRYDADTTTKVKAYQQFIDAEYKHNMLQAAAEERKAAKKIELDVSQDTSSTLAGILSAVSKPDMQPVVSLDELNEIAKVDEG